MQPPLQFGLLTCAGVFLAGLSGDLSVVVLVVVVLAQAIFLYGWSQLPIAAAFPGALLASGLCAVADGAVVLVGPDGPVADAAGAVAGALGIGVVLAFALQLARRDGRPTVTVSVAATVAALLIGTGAAAWIRVGWDVDAVPVTCALAAGIAAAAGAVLLPGDPRVRLLVAAVAGTALAAASGAFLDVPVAVAGAAGLTGAVGAAAVSALVTMLQQRRAALCVGSTVPLLMAGPVVLGLLRLPGG